MKVSKTKLEALLASCTLHYNRLYGTTTVCQVVMPNKFTLAIGQSSCLDINLYDEKLVREYAKADALSKAMDKLWELEAYRLAMNGQPICGEEE